MKSLIVLSALAFSTQTFAKTFICESETGFFGEEHRIVLNDKENDGMILTKSGDRFEVSYEKAIVHSNRWGFNIHASGNISVDWNAPENQNRCLVWGKNNMNFVLKTEELVGDEHFKGTLYVSPHFIVKPNVRCQIPALALPAPVELKCKLY